MIHHPLPFLCLSFIFLAGVIPPSFATSSVQVGRNLSQLRQQVASQQKISHHLQQQLETFKRKEQELATKLAILAQAEISHKKRSQDLKKAILEIQALRKQVNHDVDQALLQLSNSIAQLYQAQRVASHLFPLKHDLLPHEQIQKTMVLQTLVPNFYSSYRQLCQEIRDLKGILERLEHQEEDLKKQEIELAQQKRSLMMQLQAQADTQGHLVAKYNHVAQQLALFSQQLPNSEAFSLKTDQHSFIRPAFGICAKPTELDSQHDPRGLIIKTAPKATVVAPASGKVAFIGVFRQYNQLVILDHGKGLHSLLIGLETVDVKPHQVIVQGAKVGTMPEDATSALYFEVRKNGIPIPQTFS